MAHKPFDKSIDVYSGPGFGLFPTYKGTYPGCLITQGPIQTIGLGAVPIPVWMTIDAYRPIGAWTTTGFGMDARIADQIAWPPGTPPQYWVVYTDKIVYYAGTPYYRAYLSPLPLPQPVIQTANARVIFSMPHMSVERPNLVLGTKTIVPTLLRVGMTPAVRRGGIRWRSSINRSYINLQMRPVAFPAGVKLRPTIQSNYLRLQASANALPKVIQKAINQAAANSVTTTWPTTTTANSLLVAVATISTVSAGGSSPTISMPAGWTAAGQFTKTVSAQAATVGIYYKQNAPSQSGTVLMSSNWASGSPFANIYTLHLFEVAPLNSNGAADTQTNGSGQNTSTLPTGTAGTTTNLIDWSIYGACEMHAPGTSTFSLPTNGYTIEQQASISPGGSVTSSKALTSFTTTSTQVTTNQTTGIWAAMLVNFK